MLLNKLAGLFTSKKTDKAVSNRQDETPIQLDVTRLPLFAQVDPTVRYMVNKHQQFIREHITFIDYWINKKDYTSAASLFIQLKWVDCLNPEIPRFEQNAELMSVVETRPQQPDPRKLYCSFWQVYIDVKHGKDMFQLTDEGYKDIVTSPDMPNRAYGLGESWRIREVTPEDEKYYDTARQIIFHYYLVGFDTVDHPSFKRLNKD